jgi:hypothetical protein
VTRERITAPDHDRNRSLGWLAVRWMEHFTLHGPGDVEGQAVVLDDELTELTVDSYVLGATGRRQYDSAFISRAKGRDKSGHAARYVLFEGMGPCRFDGWAKGGEQYRWRDFVHTYEPGDPMGRPIVHPFIRCLATEESQAGNTYDNVYYNLTEGPLAEGLPRDAAGLTRTNLPGGGEIIPSTASNASKDGGKETFVVYDETHLYVQPELHRMYATVRRNMAKRKAAEPWSLETSTMYLPGEGSVAEETHKLAKLIFEGKTKRARLLFDHRQADPDTDIFDEASLLAGLREVYGPFAEVMDLERIVAEFWDPRNSEADSRRYFLNQPTSAANAWLRDYEWKGCTDSTKVVGPNEAITLGFDGSKSRKRGVTDATVLVGCRVSDGHTWVIRAWEEPPGPAGDGWEVPTVEVDAAVRQAFKDHHVVAFYADPAKWESYVASWEADFHERLKVKATQRSPIHYWINEGRSIIVTRAIDKLRTAVIDKEMTHDGGEVLTRHVLNARQREGRSGIWIVKPTIDGPQKIDGAWAAVCAYAARLDCVAAGVTDRKKPTAPRRIR